MKKKTIIMLLLGVMFLTSVGYCDSQIEIVFYGVEACSDCVIVNNYLDMLVDKYDGLKVIKKDLSDESIEVEFISISNKLGVHNTIPFVLVKGVPLVGREEIESRLEDILVNGCDDDFDVNCNETKQGVLDIEKERASTFSIITMICAGLVDGINPCALAMLIFFLTLIINLDDKKNIWGIALTYIIASFLTYYLLGIGIMKVLIYLDGMKTIMLVIYIIVLVLCGVFLILNIYDFIKLCGGDLNIKNQLSNKMRKRIHKTLESKVGSKFIYLSVFIAGVVVSILEFACTGQVYIPTLTFLISRGEGKLMYYIYLIIYNLCFITPLIIVTLFVNKLKDTLDVSDVLLNNLKYIKLITSCLYVVFIIYMIKRVILII